MRILLVVLCALLGYLFGSINSAVIVGKFHGIDIRKHGSGNAGTTNVLRILGKMSAVFVLVGDILKGVAACLAGLLIAGETGLMIGGIFAVLGHNWPMFFGFKGGKGALTSIAVVMMMDYRIGLIIITIFVLTTAVTRFVSLGSILGGLMFPILSLVFNKSTEFVLFALFIGLLVTARHYSNIERMFKGTESKLGGKKGSDS